ncbi:hypothetical protein B0H19DRAFT_1213641 [Mycena capillaripes]|nr:hypothetical protein B0H19DRAFT_1213641 [Mycena capillaripes]
MLLLALGCSASCYAITSPVHGVTSSPDEINGRTYDYIVIGGGLAGLTLASRQSEDRAISVLAVEAGGDDRENPEVFDIYEFTVALGGPLDWAYPAESGRIINSWRAVDARIRWEGMLHYMRKSENFMPPTADQIVKGSSDPCRPWLFGPVHSAFSHGMYASVMNASGICWKAELCDSESFGEISPTVGVQSINYNDDDHRSSSAQSYLKPVEKPEQTGHKIPLVASGIEFATYTNTTNGTTRYVAHARREVIVSAGALRTSAVLQLSGIGDAELLEPLNITTLIGLKTVGRNLQEQSEIESSIGTWAESQAVNGHSAAALETIFRAQANIILKDKAPMVEMFYVTGPEPLSFDEIATNVWQLLPSSRGRVDIVPTNPFEYPNVHVNYFNVSFDLAVHTAPAKLLRKISKRPRLGRSLAINSTPARSAVPDDGEGGTDADWQAWVLQNYGSVAHPLGTTSMMRRELGGVVDAYLKVYDTRNVRVVDASIFPTQLSAHLSATMYGVAEKAADLIKAAQ